MPANKDFKRLVRRRMQKTGESYTAARVHLLNNAKPVLSGPPPEDYAKIAGIGDASLKAKTGCTWVRWVNALDRAGAGEWSHREIATLIRSKYKTGDWWSQMITVGYERIRGLRDRGQRRGGGYAITKSKTFAVPLTKLYRAWSDRATRESWLPGVALVVRTARRGRSMRITWPDATNVDVGFSSRAARKAQVAVEHSKLKDKSAAVAVRSYWTERFAALADVLVR